MTSSVSSGFLHLISTISGHSNDCFLLAIDLITYGTRLGCFCLYHEQAKCQLLNCFAAFFPVSLAAFGCWAALPPDNISLNCTNKKTVHATFDTEQLIFHTRTAPTDMIASLPGSD